MEPEAPEEEEAPHDAASHAASSAGLSEFDRSMALMTSLRSVVRADSEAAIAAADARARAVVESEQARSREHSTTMLRMFELVRPHPNAESDVVALLREELREMRREMRALRERDLEPPEEPEEEETDDERVEKFVKKASKDGIASAVRTLMGEQTAASVFRMLPKIQDKLPDAMRFLNGLVAEVFPPGSTPPGAPPAPPRPKQPRLPDPLTPTVT